MEYHVSDIKQNTISVLFGGSDSEQQQFIRHFLFHFRKIPLPMILGEKAKEITNHVHGLLVCDTLDQEKIDYFMTRAVLNDSESLIVFYNCFEDIKEMQKLIVFAKYIQCTVLIVSKKCPELSYPIRSKTDYVFSFRIEDEVSKRNLFNQYFGSFQSYGPFCEYYNEIVPNNKILVSFIDDHKFMNWNNVPIANVFEVGSPYYSIYRDLKNTFK